MTTRNLVLAALSSDRYARLEPEMEQVDITPGQPVYCVNEVMDRVYFPLTGVYCEYVVLQTGATVEVGTIGNEGMVGLWVYFGARVAPALIEGQVAGVAMTMPAEAFRAAVERSPGVRAAVGRYAQAHLGQVAQSAACNAVHTVKQRLIRWLLLTDDRIEHGRFRLTQDLVARMLGARRETVTVAANRLKHDGLVRYSRGWITVADRAGLEASACECYRQTAERYRALLAAPNP